jgi:hypothetical protein
VAAKSRGVTKLGNSQAPSGVRRGTIVLIDERGRVFVTWDTCEKPVAAVLADGIDLARARTAMSTKREGILAFEEGEIRRPILLGFVASESLSEAAAGKAPATVVEADVDGRRVRVIAQDEIVLECGKASITMRRNGKVIVRGTHVETNSDGTNRIKGGQVKIN